jgi:hypothetical protein
VLLLLRRHLRPVDRPGLLTVFTRLTDDLLDLVATDLRIRAARFAVEMDCCSCSCTCCCGAVS